MILDGVGLAIVEKGEMFVNMVEEKEHRTH